MRPVCSCAARACARRSGAWWTRAHTRRACSPRRTRTTSTRAPAARARRRRAPAASTSTHSSARAFCAPPRARSYSASARVRSSCRRRRSPVARRTGASACASRAPSKVCPPRGPKRSCSAALISSWQSARALTPALHNAKSLCVRVDCGGYLTAPRGFIQSPRFPLAYTHELDCRCNIRQWFFNKPTVLH